MNDVVVMVRVMLVAIMKERSAGQYLAAWHLVAPETVIHLTTPPTSQSAVAPRNHSLYIHSLQHLPCIHSLPPSLPPCSTRTLRSHLASLWAPSAAHRLILTLEYTSSCPQDGLWRFLDNMHKGANTIMRARRPAADQRRRGHPDRVLFADN